MNNPFKYLFVTFANALIVMTLILSPIPGKSISYASDSNQTSTSDLASADSEAGAGADCDEEENQNEDGSPGIYKAGCQFNKDLGKSKVKNHYPGGVKGIIEQFVGATFAMIGITLFWNPIPNSKVMCPQNFGAELTFPIVQAGSLSYLIGEVSANMQFKKASKMAVDASFQAKRDEKVDNEDQAKKNKEANNKQLEAYGTLMKIYDHQVKGLERKVMMATLAEAAFISATAIEISNIVNMEANCKGIQGPLKTKDAAFVTSLKTKGIPLLAAQAQMYASVPDPTATTKAAAAGCNLAGGYLGSYLGLSVEQIIEIMSATSAENAVKVTEASSQNAELAAHMGGVATTILTGGLTAALPKHYPEIAKDQTQAGLNDAMDLKNKASRKAIIGMLTPQASLCAPVGGQIMAEIAAREAVRAMPIYCCGTQTLKSATLDSSEIQPASFNPDQSDQNMVSKYLSQNTIDKKEKMYVKTLVGNALRRIAMETMYKKFPDNPQREVRMIANIESYINYILDNQDALLEDSNIKKEYEELKRRSGQGSPEVQNYLLATIKKLKSEILIASANANAFKELLNIGTKIVLLYFTMGSWMRENAFPKPKNRAWTWGIMSVVNGAVLMFDKKSKSDAKKRYDIVVEEAQRFADSHALRTSFGTSGSYSSSGSDYGAADQGSNISGKNTLAYGCAKQDGKGYSPAPCPTVIPRSKFSFPVSRKVPRAGIGPLGQALPMISQGAFTASTQGMDKGLKALKGTVGGITKIRPALRAHASKLIDKMDKEVISKQKDKKGKTPMKLSTSMGKFRSIFSGDVNKSGVSGNQLASGAKGLLPKIEKLELESKKKNSFKPGAVAAVPTFDIPKTPSFDFDLDDGEAGTTNLEEGESAAKGEENLEEFIVDSGEINENTETSIFKLISNRYLRSYPVLLEEDK